ncbi:hypothetical protein ACQ4PT_057649 [Festuca glaucescens]
MVTAVEGTPSGAAAGSHNRVRSLGRSPKRQQNFEADISRRPWSGSTQGASSRTCDVPKPPVQAQASTSGEFHLSDFNRPDVLGRGNWGTVYKVTDRRTSALYALKVMHGGEPGSTFPKADILWRADSPYVLRCHSVLSAATSGDVTLLLEPADSGSLDSVMARRGAFPEAALADVAAQELSGLAYLHARRVFHCDVKPANLLVGTAGEVKIVDFGIAKVLSRVGDEYEGTTA